MKILAHTCFIGTTGYAEHSRAFFCALNKYHTVKVRNQTVGPTWKGMSNTPHDNESYITKEMKDMMILQILVNSDNSHSDYPMYDYKGDFKPDVHIVLNDMDNYQFYEDHHDGYKIAYNVYESTRYPDGFFKRLLTFDEMWVPTQWQLESLVEQGYPREKIVVIPEAVDSNTFKPIAEIPKKDKFRFLLFGRWDYRKASAEVQRAFGETFKDNPNVELIASIENPYSYDETKSTEERQKKHSIYYDNIKYIKFTPRSEYIKYLQEGHVFLSCARSEGWNLPLIEAMSCGIPSIYSNWGGQLEFAKDKGIPVKISHLRPANIANRELGGDYCEPDFEDLAVQMKKVYENYDEYRKKALEEAEIIHEEFTWDKAALRARKTLEKREDKYVYVTAGNLDYMVVIQKMVESLNIFSKKKVIVYGIDCNVPFDSPNMIKRRLDPVKHSVNDDRWYWKHYACIDSLKEDYNNFVWVDGDVIVNHNIDDIKQYFPQLENYPLPDIHVNEEFSGYYLDENNVNQIQFFCRKLAELWNVVPVRPYMHACFFIYNKECKWWFEELIQHFINVDPKFYSTYFLWNDEGIDNAMRWKYGFRKHLPLSNFDTSGYDGDDGFTNEALQQFYKYCNEDGPQNFNKVYGWRIIPENKSQILYFHGNKNPEFCDKMIEAIKVIRDNDFYDSMYFYTDIYNLENLGKIFEIPGATLEIAAKYGWHHAVFHEIYNLRDYYLGRVKRINKGDIVVDVGANMGVFTRWAYSEGANQVISFEPDHRYFKLLKLNSHPKTILFNAAISDKVGTTTLTESDHFGGSNILNWGGEKTYSVRTYTLDYLFETGLIDKIDFLKIDIEGAEQLAFKGISDKNLMKVSNIAMEYHHSHLNFDTELRTNLIRRLINLGFNSHLLLLGTDESLQMLYFWR